MYRAAKALNSSEPSNQQGRYALEILEKGPAEDFDHDQQIERQFVRCRAHAMCGEKDSLSYLTDALREMRKGTAGEGEAFEDWLEQADDRPYWRQRARTISPPAAPKNKEKSMTEKGITAPEEAMNGLQSSDETASAQAHFQGLPICFKAVVILITLFFGLFSVGFAYHSSYKVLKTTELNTDDVEVLKAFYDLGVNKGGVEPGVNKGSVEPGVNKGSVEPGVNKGSVEPALYQHLFDVFTQYKLIVNHQTRALLGMACGIALFALGFALFIIGVEGSFQLNAQGKGGFGLSLSSAAPGILCFLLGAWLIYAGITRRHELSTNAAYYGSGTAATQSQSQCQTIAGDL